MTDKGQIIGESDFKIIDKNELENSTSNNKTNGNLRDDLIELGFLDYNNLSKEEKIIFDEMKNEKRDDFYKLD